MKNLKKVLSLVLALAMALSLMTVAFAKDAGDYTDYDTITNKEAVEVLTALDVIDGMGNNTFQPSGNVTRAQMAKMITIISLGDVDPSAFLGTVTDLKDINGHWAEAYIKYCYSQGIISGRGNGIFDPNANVTSAEAAKMLLTAIGYNSDVQGYTGTQWAINVTRDAQLSGFYDGVSVPANQALTRDQAAQMIYNAVGAVLIEATPNWNASTGTVTYTYEKNSNGETLLSETFNTKEYVGVMDDITYTDSNKKYAYNNANPLSGSTPTATAFENKVNNSDKHTADFTTTDDYTALEGEEVSVIVKTEKNGDETVLGIYATGKSTVINANVSALEADGDKLKVNGTSYEIDGTNVTISLAVANSYNTVKLVDSDDNGELDTAIVTTVTPGKVTYVSDEEVIAGGTTYKFEDDEIPSGLAKDDYVTVVTKLNGVNVLTKLEPITGEVDGLRETNTEARIGGVWYVVNGESELTTLGNEVEFYAVNGVVVANSAEIVSGATISNLVMVLDRDDTTNVLNAQALIMDATGTKSTVTIDKSTAVTLTPGGLYFYEETSAGYKFSTPQNTADGKYTWAAANTVATVPGTSATINSVDVADDAVIFVFTPDDKNGAVITGKQLKSLTVTSNTTGGTATDEGKVLATSKGSFTSVVSGLTRVSYAGVQLYIDSDINDLSVASGNTNYAYVTDDSYAARLNNENYQTYTIWNGTENVTVYEKGTVVRSEGDIMKYDTIGTDNIITGVSVYAVTDTAALADITNKNEVAAVRGTEGDYIYLDGTTAAFRAELTSDTKYLYVDSNAEEAEDIGKAGGEVVLADEYGTGIYMDNVIAVVNASDEVVLLVVDVKNNMTVVGTNDSNTASISATLIANATAAVSKTSNIKAGDAIEVTFTATGAVTTDEVTIANGQTADGSSTFDVPDMASGDVFKITVFADGAGAVSFSI